MFAPRPQRKVSNAVCDGTCHCNDCQFMEKDGEVFVEKSGHLCKCREFYIATKCWNNNIPCYKCFQSMKESAQDKGCNIFYSSMIFY